MKKENDELVDLFRSRLENAKMPVRNDLWESLQEEIPMVIHRKHKHIMYRFAAAASVLLILMGSSAAFLYFSPKEEIANAFTKVTVPAIPKGKTHTDAVIVELPPMDKTAAAYANTSRKGVGYEKQIMENEEEMISMSFSMSFSFSSSNQDNRTQSFSEVTNEVQSMYSEESEIGAQNEEQSAETITEPAKNNNKKWAIGAFAATGLKHHKEGISHKMPLSAGLTIQRDLSPRIALESGLVYTQLNADLDINNIHSKQKLHYIGIPVKANLSLHETNHLNIYASAGGMIEKCISGGTDAFQASLSTGIGLECKINPQLSLYMEPGISYHFDDGSSLNTLRSERPLNINLLCGVRMTY